MNKRSSAAIGCHFSRVSVKGIDAWWPGENAALRAWLNKSLQPGITAILLTLLTNTAGARTEDH